jgi:hypothetical protein
VRQVHIAGCIAASNPFCLLSSFPHFLSAFERERERERERESCVCVCVIDTSVAFLSGWPLSGRENVSASFTFLRRQQATLARQHRRLWNWLSKCIYVCVSVCALCCSLDYLDFVFSPDVVC